jgi:ubiquinone/menaquinone biosynthesis C-methylase UbiE
MTIKDSYNSWAENYDAMENKTRDLEKTAIRKTLKNFKFEYVIELGCGTGKNTKWLAERSEHLIAVDFSEKMLSRAKKKIKSNKVNYLQYDLTKPWKIKSNFADLISCSLVLEHIYNLNFLFREARKKLKTNGIFYICELHPFKQYQGSKARYETENGTVELEVFVHNISEYIESALKNGFELLELNEWFDNSDEIKPPRLISFVFKKL